MFTTFHPQPPWGLPLRDAKTGLPPEVIEVLKGEGITATVWTHYSQEEQEGVLGYMLYRITTPLGIEPRRFVPLKLRRSQ